MLLMLKWNERCLGLNAVAIYLTLEECRVAVSCFRVPHKVNGEHNIKVLVSYYNITDHYFTVIIDTCNV